MQNPISNPQLPFHSKALTLLILLLSTLTISTQAQTFPFGKASQLHYNPQSGHATIKVKGSEVISNAYALVKNGEKEISSLDYTQRSISETSLNDAFGKGKKISITLRSAGLPNMEQVFYLYADHDYFFTEVSLRGEEVSSNFMAPLVSNKVSLGKEGDNRVLFVPFDNDTFISYNSKSLQSQNTSVSAEVTAFYENNSRTGLIFGSVEHYDWKTGIKTSGQGGSLSELMIWGGYTEKNVTRDQKEHGKITGKTIKSPKIFIGYFEDWREGLEEYGKANSLSDPRYVMDWEGPAPFGWNSWGALQTKLNLENSKAVADFFTSTLPEFRNDGAVYIGLDSYWDNMIKGGLEGDFSQLKAFADYCKQQGLKPGIYWAPFVDWGKWDRKVEGSTYTYQEVWTKVNGSYHDLDDARALDPTHPATQKRIDLVIDKFKECGFELIKIDFIGHAAIEADTFYDPTIKTGMQAFAAGMKYLIDRLDSKMLVYTAISPNLATGPYTHSRRIACDAYADIDATQYTLNSTTYGWWQNHIYHYIDADHLVFGNEAIGANRARLASGIINGTITLGDDYSKSGSWISTAKALLNNQDLLDLAQNGKSFQPVEGNTETGASEVFTQKIGDTHYVAIFNYGKEKPYTLNLNRLGIEKGEYTIKELFTGNHSTIKGSTLEAEIAAEDAVIFRIKKD